MGQIAVVVTRSCIGIWDFMTGKLKFRLANSALGAIITHAIVNEEGSHVVAAESGDLLYWDLKTKQVTFKDKQEDIQQIFFYKNQDQFKHFQHEEWQPCDQVQFKISRIQGGYQVGSS